VVVAAIVAVAVVAAIALDATKPGLRYFAFAENIRNKNGTARRKPDGLFFYVNKTDSSSQIQIRAT
jgi:hypothetical protein